MVQKKAHNTKDHTKKNDHSTKKSHVKKDDKSTKKVTKKTTVDSNKNESKKSQSTSKKTENSNFSYKKITGILALVVVVLAVVFAFTYLSNDDNLNENPMQGNNQTNQDEMTQDMSGVVATVDGEELTQEDLQVIIDSLSSNGQEISRDQALEQLVVETALTQEAEQGGFMPSTQEVTEMIETEIAAQGMNLEEFKTQMEESGANFDQELELYRLQMGIQAYLESRTSQMDLNVTQEEMQEFYAQYSAQSQEEVPPYEEIEEQIRAQLEQQKQGELVDGIIAELLETKEIVYN